MIIIHAYMQIQPEQEAAFLEEIQTLIEATRQEPGNISYELMKSTETDYAYARIELWKDMEAAGLHNTSEHFTSFVQKAPQFLSAPMDAKLFTGEPLELK